MTRKSCTFLSLLFLAAGLFAQPGLILEHQYKGCLEGRRQILNGLGEVYSCYNAAESAFHLYDGGHQLIRSIPAPELPVPADQLDFVTAEAFVLPNSGELRAIFGFGIFGPVGTDYLLHEAGNILLEVNGGISLSQVEGEAPQLRVLNNGQVVFLDAGSLDTVWVSPATSVRRTGIEGIGGVYYYVDDEDVIHAFGPDGQPLHEGISLAGLGSGGNWQVFPSRYVFNEDDALEYHCTFFSISSRKVAVVDESGTPLLEIDGAGQGFISRVEGQPPFFMVESSLQNQAYRLPGLELAYTFPGGDFSRFASEDYGFLFAVGQDNGNLDIYTPDNTFLKNMQVPATGPWGNAILFGVSEREIISDEKIEAVTITYSGPGTIGSCLAQNEEGEILFYGEQVRQFAPTHLPGHGRKVVVNYRDKVEVYREEIMSATEPAVNGQPAARLYPNPFSEELWVECPAAQATGFRLLTSLGKMAASGNISPGAKRTAISTGPLPSGLYHLQLLRDGAVIETRKVVKR